MDQAKSEAFAERFLSDVNSAAVVLMTSVGHQVGLFDAMAGKPPATSEKIAAEAGLNERYVREWLGAMVTGRVIDYDPDEGTYGLPPEHAAWLTRAAGVDNMAITSQYIPLIAEVEQQVIGAFRQGGGVPYSAYTRFHRLMAEDSANVNDAALIDTILPLVPGLPERLKAGIDVADVGCGSGHAINLMAKAFPASRFVGYDLSEEAISTGRGEAKELGLENARFEVQDAATLDEVDHFDFITAFDAIHDQAQPAEVLKRISQALRRDGVFLMVDIQASSRLHENMDHPLGPFLYTISTMHCMTVSLALDGMGLGTVWGEQKAREMLADAGFTDVDVESIEGDPINSYYIARKA
jgi:SAM-dependent methyltransferase